MPQLTLRARTATPPPSEQPAPDRHNRRGWRIDKPNPRANIDAVIALAMAVERGDHRPEPVQLLGWL